MATSSYTYPTSSSQVINTVPHTNILTTKESNLDLLTGLDFSASQIPTLVPQQNVPEKTKEIEIKPPVVDVTASVQTPKVKEEPKEIPIKEAVRILPSKPLSNSEVSIVNLDISLVHEKYHLACIIINLSILI